MANKIIAIDGPSSSGKGTIAKLVANQLNFDYLDSGSIYRALALVTIRNKIATDNIAQILKLLGNLEISFCSIGVFIGQENITDKIREESIGMMASTLSKNPEIRLNLLDYQRSFAKHGNLVTDGRDMGNIVFPKAQLKVFLTASAEKRAQRRFKQLQDSGKPVKMESILRDIILRDRQDSERSVAPLRFGNDYKLLDNTNLTIRECVEQIVDWYNQFNLGCG